MSSHRNTSKQRPWQGHGAVDLLFIQRGYPLAPPHRDRAFGRLCLGQSVLSPSQASVCGKKRGEAIQSICRLPHTQESKLERWYFKNFVFNYSHQRISIKIMNISKYISCIIHIYIYFICIITYPQKIPYCFKHVGRAKVQILQCNIHICIYTGCLIYEFIYTLSEL